MVQAILKPHQPYIRSLEAFAWPTQLLPAGRQGVWILLMTVVVCYGVTPLLLTVLGAGWLLASLSPWAVFAVLLFRRLGIGAHRINGLVWLGLWPFPQKVALAKAVGMLLLGQAVLMLLWAVVSQNLAPEVSNPLQRLGSSQRLLFAVIAAGLAPVFEEVIFRGWIQQGLSCLGGSAVFRIVLTSLVFGLLHQGGQTSWVPLVYITVMSLWLGWGREWTGSLWPGIIAHGLHNAAALAILWHQAVTLGGRQPFE